MRGSRPVFESCAGTWSGFHLLRDNLVTAVAVGRLFDNLQESD